MNGLVCCPYLVLLEAKAGNNRRTTTMAEFSQRGGWKSTLRNRLRSVGFGGIIALVAVVFLISGPNAERIGDRFQITLPLFALACAAAEGRAVQLVGRYVLLEVFIKTPKHTLGMTPINVRPNGKDAGFPSGHTAVATFGATALVQSCLKDSPSAQAVAIMAAGFTGASRISSDNHNIWQVLAGAILGFCIQFLGLAAFDRAFSKLWARGRAAVTGLASRFGARSD